MSKSVDSFNLYKVSEAILANPLMACIVVDEHGIIRFINQAYLEWLHKDKDEVMGKHILEVTPHSKLPEVLRSGKAIWLTCGRLMTGRRSSPAIHCLKMSRLLGRWGRLFSWIKPGRKYS